MKKHTPTTTAPQRAALLLFAVVAIVTSFIAPPTQAAVVYNPASIVDHGAYITDTANHLDWYKFSNQVNTVGLSHDGYLAAALPGWSIASIAQVQGLENQFNYAGDTAAESFVNYGLTYAMASYLGYTGVFYSGNNYADGTFFLQAITSDVIVFFNPVTQQNDDLQYLVTTAQTYTQEIPGGTFLYGDYVNAYDGAIKPGDTDAFTGIWLSRASQDSPADCGRLAPCAVDVPEPASPALLMLGLCGIAAFGRNRFK